MQYYKATIAVIMPILTGGTERHAKEMTEAWSKQGHIVLWVQVNLRVIHVDVLFYGKIIRKHDLFFFSDLEHLKKLFKAYDVKLIHFEHILDLAPLYFDIQNELEIPAAIVLHDYYTICPFITISDEEGNYCGEKGVAACQTCLMRRKYYSYTFQKNILDIVRWRNFWYSFLKKIALIIVPDEDVRKRMQQYYPELSIKVIPNPEIQDVVVNSENLRRQEKAHTRIRIGLLGTLSKHKGGPVLLKCAQLAEKQNRPLEFVLFGTFEDKEKSIPANLHVMGKYQETEIFNLIAQQDIDFFWFPACWPETYSYTLSIPVRLKIPVLTTDLGAIQRRVLAYHWGETYRWNISIEEMLCRLANFNFKSYLQPGVMNPVTNLSFPQAEDFYAKIMPVNMTSCVDYDLVQKVEIKNEQELQMKAVKKLKGRELKFLFQHATSWHRKYNLVKNIDKTWLINFWQRNSIGAILQKIF